MIATFDTSFATSVINPDLDDPDDILGRCFGPDTLLVWFVMVRSVLLPMQRIIETMRQREQGDLAARVTTTAVRGPAVDVAKSINEMMDRVHYETEQREIAAAQNQRLAHVAAATLNLVVITNPDGAIEWVNAAFEERTGWKLAEVRGQKPGELLQGPETDPATVDLIRRHVQKGQGIRTEIINYNRQENHIGLSSIFDRSTMIAVA